MSNNIEALEKTLPAAPMKLVAMESCKDLGTEGQRLSRIFP